MCAKSAVKHQQNKQTIKLAYSVSGNHLTMWHKNHQIQYIYI